MSFQFPTIPKHTHSPPFFPSPNIFLTAPATLNPPNNHSSPCLPHSVCTLILPSLLNLLFASSNLIPGLLIPPADLGSVALRCVAEAGEGEGEAGKGEEDVRCGV